MNTFPLQTLEAGNPHKLFILSECNSRGIHTHRTQGQLWLIDVLHYDLSCLLESKPIQYFMKLSHDVLGKDSLV